MSDRLPVPLEDARGLPIAERASAAPARPARRVAAGVDENTRVESTTRAPRTLREVESWMVAAIAGSESDAERAPAFVTAGPRLSARERFEIYRDAYRARLVECLVDDYPVISQRLGHESFEELAVEYIGRFPSRSPSLNAFGRHMVRCWREAAPHGFEESRAFFAELARLEWAIVEAIHAPFAAPFDVSALQAVPPDALGDARLIASGSVELLRFEYPVNAYYQKCRIAGECPDVPKPHPSATAVYRHNLRIWRMDLTPAMTGVLEALLAGTPIGASLACMGVDESDPAALAEAERSVMVWFKEWIQCGFFSGVQV